MHLCLYNALNSSMHVTNICESVRILYLRSFIIAYYILMPTYPGGESIKNYNYDISLNVETGSLFQLLLMKL